MANETKKPLLNKSAVAPEKVASPAPRDNSSTAEGAARVDDLVSGLPSGGAKNRGGRPSNAARREAEEKAKADAEAVEAAQKIYTAEIWGPVAALPFDIAFLVTKYAGFPLSKEERERTGFTLAQVVKYYADIDPKYLMLVAFLTDYLTLAGKKVIAWQVDMKARKPIEKNSPNT